MPGFVPEDRRGEDSSRGVFMSVTMTQHTPKKGGLMSIAHTLWRYASHPLASLWRRLRGTTAAHSNPHSKAAALGATPLPKVSVVIPALNEAARIADVVRYALSDPVTAEVIVIDDSSIDDTAQLARMAGARVIRSTMLGKGRSMLDGLQVAEHDVIAYLDGDLAGLRERIISDLVAPIARNEADFVKARFGRGGGRVTELTAKPMLKLFFPELARFAQPLGGIIAARHSLLQTMRFEDGYGVDVGLLIDAHRAGARLAEVDIGSLEHDSQSLHALGLMAQEVGRVIFDRAKRAGRLTVDQILSIYELERQNQADIDHILLKLRGCEKIALLCMDGVVSTSSYVHELAIATGRAARLSELLRTPEPDVGRRVQSIAQVFRFVHKQEFEAVAHALDLRPQVIETVNALRRMGYKVGVVSDGYFIAAEIVRRRIFADFALANTMGFESEVCQGEVRLNRAYAHDAGCATHAQCSSNLLHYLRHGEREVPLRHIVAVGSGAHDRCLLHSADYAFMIEPRGDELRRDPGIIELRAIDELMKYITPLDEGGDAADREAGARSTR